MFRLWDPPLPFTPPGMDISSQLFYLQEREQITEIDPTVVPWQARLAQSHRDETSRQHRPFQRHSCMFFFNLDVLLCFCHLHPPTASEKYPRRRLACLLSVSPSSDHSPMNKATVSKAVRYQRTSYLSLWHQREQEETVRRGNRGNHWERGGMNGWARRRQSAGW